MPQFQLVTSKATRPLGKFNSITDVAKLRFFKDNPDLMQFVSEVRVTKPIYRSVRWRVILSESYYDLLGLYSREEAEAVLMGHMHGGTLRLVHKYEYHESDGII